MRLRNKNTGEIFELDKLPKWLKETIQLTATFYSRECEVYEPKEPLIEDPKVRKAVRAWADANGIDESSYYKIKFDHSEHRLKWIRTIIEFDRIEGLENLDDGKEYTIAELCGEEK